MYSEPNWQQHLPNQSILAGMRGLPDVAWGAANFILYENFYGVPTWSPHGGTSAGGPQWAGLIAIADQMANTALGFLNPGLYRLARKGFHDITQGDNSIYGVAGYRAASGWDPATGWGTPDAAVLLPQLIAAAQQTGT